MNTEIRAEIPATVLSLHAAIGQMAETGDLLMLLESMKMEIPVVAEGPGTIVGLPVGAGATVREGDLIAVIRPRDPIPG